MNKSEFKSLLSTHHIDLTALMEEQFATYLALLQQWNQVMNLTAITDESGVYEKHFYDSFGLAMALPLMNQSVCDVGSGAGFPSLPLKIAFPNLKVTLVDPLQKRMRFLEELIKALGVSDTHLVVSRAEDYLQGREQFDIVTARAVASLPILLELCVPLVKVGGYFVAFKGSQGEEELNQSKQAMKKLHVVLDNTFSFMLPYEQSMRQLYLFKKVQANEKTYPRPFAQIKSHPL